EVRFAVRGSPLRPGGGRHRRGPFTTVGERSATLERRILVGSCRLLSYGPCACVDAIFTYACYRIMIACQALRSRMKQIARGESGDVGAGADLSGWMHLHCLPRYDIRDHPGRT